MQSQAIIHTVSNSEKQTFTQHVNDVLKNDKDIRNRLPISLDKIFDEMQDGIIFCKLINAAVPGKVPPISPEAINFSPQTAYHKIENLNLAISSAKSIGCTAINVRPEFITEKRQHIVLGLIWQITRIHISNTITLKRYPQILVLMKQDEDESAINKLGYEEILIRWLNYHIRKNADVKVIKNLGSDLSDSEAYGHVLTNVAKLDKSFWIKDQKQRAEEIIATCRREKIITKVSVEEIVSGNTRLNTILCVDIFNQRHGLESIKIVELPPEAETDQTKEQRIFKNWINSQGIEDGYVNYLMNDLRDGRIILKIIDKLRPNTVDWEKRYSNKLISRIHKIQNCNYALEICKNIGVKLIGIDGVDIVDGKVTLTLGLVWQICRIYLEERVGKINDEELVAWGNSKVPNDFQIKNLKDSSIGNCKFLLHIIDSIKPKIIDFSKLKDGNTQEDQIVNINYTIASARKLGAEVMTLWDHIEEANPRYVGILLAELQYIEKIIKRK